jgi:D-alanyl-lipoteichoic acid acyltransferase DltB (MBOAT superfamily)
MNRQRQGKAFMILSILTNLAVLGFFKYFNFFSKSLLSVADDLGIHTGWTLPHIILPVGISFYTFQSISYAVDCHRGKARPCADFVTFAAYLSFFPQLVAGPIERANDLLPQFEKPAVWDNAGFHRGLRLILLGLFKKIFVGDNCAMVANYAFNNQAILGGSWSLVGVFAFAFQVYGDFSGYTDIARGSAHMLGIRLNHNFHFPYFASNPSEFWQRWHITLSSWFRDYVYIPLGGNRAGMARTLFNLWLTMLLAGLWHGANWTFILWGAYHGFLLIAYRLIPPLNRLGEQKSGWRHAAAVLVMFGFTLAGWVLFRCDTFSQLMGWFHSLTLWSKAGIIAAIKPALWCLAHALPLVAWQMATLPKRDEIENTHWKWPVRGFAYVLVLLAIFSSGAGEVQFLYFQF